jgi:hypothetical protein
MALRDDLATIHGDESEFGPMQQIQELTVCIAKIFGLPDERLTIRHDAGATPEPYVAGTLIAVRRAPGLVSLTRGLDALLLSQD